ncbi:MlaD family protein [Nocardia sp. NPDC006630]|uniref:MlaD family protein n=1 Tax=Nocardia sp. NPDC006630 TaxID=3157181 RepID=UPI0033A5B997
MKRSGWLSLFGILAVTVLGAAYLAFGVVRADPFAESFTVTLELPNSAGLQPHSPVLLRGVQVGKVDSVTHGGTSVEVALRLNRAYRIPAASPAVIESLSALGEPYVEFTPADQRGPYLSEGQRLDARTVHTPPSIPEVARQVSQVLAQLDPAAMRSLVGTFGTALTGTDTVVPELSRATGLLAATIMSRSPQIGPMLTDLQSIVPDMAWAGPSMSQAAPNFIQFGQRVDQIAAAIGRLMDTGDTPQMYLQGNGLVPFLGNLTQRIEQLGPGLKQLVPVLQPLADSAANPAPQLDLSALITQALAATEPEGAIHLRVQVK